MGGVFLYTSSLPWLLSARVLLVESILEELICWILAHTPWHLARSTQSEVIVSFTKSHHDTKPAKPGEANIGPNRTIYLSVKSSLDVIGISICWETLLATDV